MNKEPIYKNIGRMFRTHNIMEYKSPTDDLNDKNAAQKLIRSYEEQNKTTTINPL